MAKTFHVYILASRSRALYIGVTSDLLGRVFQHREHLIPGHTSRYRITRLVHYEATEDAYRCHFPREADQRLAAGKEA